MVECPNGQCARLFVNMESLRACVGRFRSKQSFSLKMTVLAKGSNVLAINST
jgi:UDP-N-acetylenolpyruvoylglucosamine reductase